MAGRPPEPVPADKAEIILEGLHNGKSLIAVCKEAGVAPRTVSGWKRKDETFRAAYARAREEGAESLVELAQEIANDGSNDTYTDDEGHTRTDHDVIARSKLRVDTLVKRAACFCPRVFGSRVQVGGDGGQPIVVQSKAEREAELAAILVQAAARADDAAGGGEGTD